VYSGNTTNPGARFWRKNRRKNPGGSFGVDLNRNWDDHWSEYGASSYEFSNTYHGPSPFSEPETKAVSDFILSKNNRVAGIDFHSYSQLILRSWGYKWDDSPNEVVLKELGAAMADAVSLTFTKIINRFTIRLKRCTGIKRPLVYIRIVVCQLF
jgi:hypothetical protein